MITKPKVGKVYVITDIHTESTWYSNRKTLVGAKVKLIRHGLPTYFGEGWLAGEFEILDKIVKDEILVNPFINGVRLKGAKK